MQCVPKLTLCGLLSLFSTAALAQATQPAPSNPQPAPAAPMSGMMMQPGSSQAAPGTQPQPQQQGEMMQGGMMQCGMMQRSAQTADAVKQLQQQVAELRSMLEQALKTR